MNHVKKMVNGVSSANGMIKGMSNGINSLNRITTRKRGKGFRQERSNGTDADLLIGMGLIGGIAGLAISHSKRKADDKPVYNPKTFRVE